MSKKLFLLMVVFGAILLGSCSSEMPVQPTNNVSDESASSILRNESEAVEIASQVVSKLSGTRASSLKVRNIGRLKKTETRSGDNGNAGFYVVNFDDENGYAVVSVDKRIQSVIAFSDEGNMNVSDTTYNEGLKAFLDYAMGVPPQGSDYGTITPKDSSIFNLHPRPDDPGQIRIEYIKRPVLPYPIDRMNQSAPYNGQCPIDPESGKHYPAGCVPVAVGEVMAFYRYPSYYNWDQIYQKPGEYWSQRLLAYLGQDILKVDYNMDGTGVVFEKIKDAFHASWYKDPIYVNSTNNLSNVLSTEGLAIVSGKNSGRHTFVLDGLLNYIIPNGLAYRDPSLGNRDIVHQFCYVVWGWGGHNNGWFSFGSTDKYLDTLNTDTHVSPVNLRYTIQQYFHKFETIPGH